MTLKDKINPGKLPLHVAIIMDGNGRWARKKGKLRVFGHQNGVKAVRETTEAAAELGIKYLTLYAFSTENWNRPQQEVDALMELLVHTINQERSTLNKNDIRLLAIGDLKSLPGNCYNELKEAIDDTSNNKRMSLVLALSYSSKWELTNAMRQIAEEVKAGKIKPEEITEKNISEHLNTVNIPDPELLIRTSGENRISNFLLWQIAYAELYFSPKLWPDFRKEDLYEAILDYQQRERRFGMVSEQLTKN
jgi:undecaprenyl diphosphate synthase